MNKKLYHQLLTMQQQFKALETEAIEPAVINDRDRYKTINQTISKLEPVINKFEAYQRVEQDLKDNRILVSEDEDPELTALAKEEIKNEEAQLVDLEQELKVLLLPEDPHDQANIIMEISGAAGGEEANLFAADLFRMYSKFAEEHRFTIEVLESHPTANGGFSFISFMVKGKGVYRQFKFESGVHRVQRVPETESQGRIHTSTTTVAVLPEPTDVEVEIKPSDLRIETYRSSGAGGQHINKTDSAVRIIYLPTNLVVTSQQGRSQHENKEHALRVLKAKIYEQKVAEENAKIENMRRSAVKAGRRSEKIRTYNYPQNRVTDHRINFTLQKLDQIMEGKLDELVTALTVADQQERLANLL